jgi:hypothetical protein
MAYMTRQDIVTGWHVKIILWVFSAFFTITIGLMGYIWNQQREIIETKFDKIERQNEKILERIELLQYGVTKNERDISVMNEWRRNWEEAQKKKNSRSGEPASMNKFVPNENEPEKQYTKTW